MKFYDINVYKYGEQYKLVYFPRFVNEYSDSLCSSSREYKNNYIGDRFVNSVSRSRNAVLGIALCNDWQYFITATLDKKKYDRFNLAAWRSDFSHWIRNQRKVHGHDFKYLLIPEQHKDGAWHMHGLVQGVPWDFLKKFDPSLHPSKLWSKGYRYHDAMLNRFGFNSFGKVRSQAAASRYILKYIAKGLGENDLDAGTHLYYCSQGLKRPEVVKQGQSTSLFVEPDFQNDFLASAWVDSADYERIKDYII